MADRLRVACVQLNPGRDLAENIERAGALVERAAADGAQLVVLPEKWNAFGTPDLVRDAAESLDDGPAVTAMRAWARDCGVALVGGSITEARPVGKPANCSLAISPQGDVVAAYRKIHMFDVDVGGTAYRESDTEQAGDTAVVAGLAGWRIGLSICFDLRYPELYRALAVAGAEIIAVPAAFTLFTGRDHWEVLLRARAIENQCYVVAAGQWGIDAGGRPTYGRSMIVGPWGVVEATAPDRDGIVVADVDRTAMARIRADLPSLRLRRPETYGDVTILA